MFTPNGKIPANVNKHVKIFAKFYLDSLHIVDTCMASSPSVHWTVKEYMKVWQLVLQDKHTVNALYDCSLARNFVNDSYQSLFDAISNSEFYERVYGLIVPPTCKYYPKISVHNQLHLSKSDYQNMSNYINNVNGIKDKIINHINLNASAYNQIEKSKLAKSMHRPQITDAKSERDFLIGWCIIAPILIMFISQGVVNFVNSGIVFTISAFIYHFFNIGLIDRIVAILFCDCPAFVGIHHDNQKIQSLSH